MGWEKNNARIVPLLGRVITGVDAEAACAAAPSADSFEMVEPFLWLPARTDMGRKTGTADILVPVRVSGAGDTTAAVTGGLGALSLSGAGYAGETGADVSPSRVTASDVDTLIDNGRDAWWDLVRLCQPEVVRAVDRAASVYAAVLDRSSVLGPVSREVIVTRVLIGEDGGQLSPFEKIMRRAVRPGCFERVDPARWLRFELKRESHRATAAHVGDPKRGGMIRRVASDVGSSSVARVHREITGRGGEAVSRDAVFRALNPACDPLHAPEENGECRW